MTIQCQMFVPPKNTYKIGAITITDAGFVLNKKSKILAHGFGAIGAIISAKMKGKEFATIPYSDIQMIEMKKYKLNKKACYITLKDNSEYIFKLPKPEQTIDVLNDAFKTSKKVHL